MSIHTDFIRDFLTRWETRQAVGYIPCQRRNYLGHTAYDPALYGPVIGVSGVTVGAGLDLGQQAEADLRRMGLAESFGERFRPYLGKREMDAVTALAAAPLTLSDAECDSLDAAVHADYIARAAALHDAEADMPFRDCPREAQAVIVSLFYQLGAGKTRYPVTWRLLCEADWPGAARELQTGFTRYANRRADEGRLLRDLPAGAAGGDSIGTPKEDA